MATGKKSKRKPEAAAKKAGAEPTWLRSPTDRRTERRFEPRSNSAALFGTLISCVGAVGLGAGVFGQFVRKAGPHPYALYLMVAGSMLFFLGFIVSSRAVPALRVGDAGLAAERGSNVRFVLLGHGNQRAKLEQMGGSHRLQFIDPLPDAEFSAVLASADILLVNELPGMTEMSVPSKLTTYFATGLPVLGAVDPGSVTADELDASGGSFRIGPADPLALLHEAERVGSDPELRKRGKRNFAYRQQTMSEDAAIPAFADLLRGLSVRKH